MDDPDAGIASSLTFECPRCGEVQQDDYEVIDLDIPTDWRCASCGRIFSVHLIDCPSCAAETAFVAFAASEHPRYREVTCCRCCKRRYGSEEVEREGIED